MRVFQQWSKVYKSEWEQKERSVKVDIMATENIDAAAMRRNPPQPAAAAAMRRNPPRPLTLERPTERPLPHNDNDDHRNWFSFSARQYTAQNLI